MSSRIIVPAEGEFVTHEDMRQIALAAATDVSALLADALSGMAHIPISLSMLREMTAFDVGNIAANGGLLASDSTPTLSAINGATDGCQVVTWAASNNDQVGFQFPIPPDMDMAADLLLYTRHASGGTTNAVGFAVATYFNEGDTAVADTSATNQTTAFLDALTTIAAADIASGARTCTIGLTPVAHTTDAHRLTNVELYYTRSLRT